MKENLFWAELIFGGSKFCVTDRAMAAKTKAKRYYSAHNVATRVGFST